MGRAKKLKHSRRQWQARRAPLRLYPRVRVQWRDGSRAEIERSAVQFLDLARFAPCPVHIPGYFRTYMLIEK
jgi:hypothetical protein